MSAIVRRRRLLASLPLPSGMRPESTTHAALSDDKRGSGSAKLSIGDTRDSSATTPASSTTSSGLEQAVSLSSSLARAAASTTSLPSASSIRTTNRIASSNPGGWEDALRQVRQRLAAGDDVSLDVANRVTALYRDGRASRTAALRWWWLLRGECLPFTPIEAACLSRRDLWRQALYTMSVLGPSVARPGTGWRREAFLNASATTASLAIRHGQWESALGSIVSGLRLSQGIPSTTTTVGSAGELLPTTCDQPTRVLSSNDALLPAVGAIAGTGSSRAPQLEHAVLAADVVAAVPSWAIALRTTVAVLKSGAQPPPHTADALRRVAMCRVLTSRSRPAWRSALRYSESALKTLVTHGQRKQQPQQHGANSTALSSPAGPLAAKTIAEAGLRLSALRMGDATTAGRLARLVLRAGSLVDPLSPLVVRQAIRALRHDVSGRGRPDAAEAVRSLKRLLLAERPKAAPRSSPPPPSVQMHATEAVVPAAATSSTPFVPILPMDALHVDEKVFEALQRGRWADGLRLVALLREHAVALGSRGIASLPPAEAAVLQLAQTPKTWRQALALYAPHS